MRRCKARRAAQQAARFFRPALLLFGRGRGMIGKKGGICYDFRPNALFGDPPAGGH